MTAPILIDTDTIREGDSIHGIKKKYFLSVGILIWILNLIGAWIIFLINGFPPMSEFLNIAWSVLILTGIFPLGWIGIILILIGKNKKKDSKNTHTPNL